jgi:hypothetical protein
MGSVRVQALLFVCRWIISWLGKGPKYPMRIGGRYTDAIGQEVVDFESQLSGAVVYDVVGH